MNRTNSKLVLLASLAAIALPSHSQVLSLDSCVALAMKANKEIQAAQHLVNQYQNTKQSLHANYFPNISLQATDAYSNLTGSSVMDISTPIGSFAAQQVQNLIPTYVDDAMRQNIANNLSNKLTPLNPEIEFKMKNIFSGGLTLEQPIFMGGKIVVSNRMGKIGVRMAQMAEHLSREDVVVSVHDAYQLLVKAKEMSVVAQKYDSLLNQISNDVKSAMKHGMASRNDELKVIVKKNDAELKIRQAENGIRLARMNLCQLIGLPLDTPIDTRDNEDTSVMSLVDRNAQVSNRTEYQLLELKSQLAEQKIKLERSEYMPQLGLIVNAGVLDGMEMLGNKLFNHKFNFTVGAQLKIPLFHGFETRHKVAAAKEELVQSRLMQEDLAGKMNLDLQQQANNVDEAQLEVRLRERNLEQCEENLRISRKAYSVGMEKLSELLTAQLLWQQAYADLVESRYQAKLKMMKWRKAAGRID